METSLFLAKLLGLYMLIMGALVLVRGKVFADSIESLANSKGFALLAGIMALIMGIAMVIGHNVWSGSWQIAVTVIGYLALLKGVILIGWPESMRWRLDLLKSSAFLKVWPFLAFALGGWLTWAGFSGA